MLYFFNVRLIIIILDQYQFPKVAIFYEVTINKYSSVWEPQHVCTDLKKDVKYVWKNDIDVYFH